MGVIAWVYNWDIWFVFPLNDGMLFALFHVVGKADRASEGDDITTTKSCDPAGAGAAAGAGHAGGASSVIGDWRTGT